ncbi:hypothetical protein Daura_19780 [Dactylosporangium aurantiacum]|uniref:DUF6292 domain-containing protein n=1 Tax=Dactylosporangium aurantiacum TaxID=35754 RepID=A0A9Q9MIR6_9ACTN|nr:DUF6292 family protein [Dactylosporangium aurantiacum]MDG6106295.1 DUF6292 family protein [Dactylosporangium aurantiacum]UWZ58209.1 hypothetical protein Daura_19780 [Dactylosporangium aurantiacum]
MSGPTAEPDPARRTRALLLLADPDLGAHPLRLGAAQRALDAGWAGTVPELLAMLRNIDGPGPGRGAVVTDHAEALREQPHYGYLLAVDRALAGRGVRVIARAVQTAHALRGQLTVDLAASVPAFPDSRRFDVVWDSAGGWSYALDRRGGARSRGRAVYWQQGLVPEPAAVAGWIARSLAGDLSLPARQGWRLDGGELMTALGAYTSPTTGDPAVPTRTAAVRPGDLDRILRRGFDRTLPPPPRVGDDVYVPSRCWRDLAPGAELRGGLTRIVKVRERPGELDWYEVTITVGEWEEQFGWDLLAGMQAELRREHGDARATLEGW